jgi:hypothetical protein
MTSMLAVTSFSYSAPLKWIFLTAWIQNSTSFYIPYIEETFTKTLWKKTDFAMLLEVNIE